METQDLIMCWYRYTRPTRTQANEYFYTCQKCEDGGLWNGLVHEKKYCINNPFVPRHIPADLENIIKEKARCCVTHEDYVLCERCFKGVYDVLVDTGEIIHPPCSSFYEPRKIPITCTLKLKRGYNTKSARGAQ